MTGDDEIDDWGRLRALEEAVVLEVKASERTASIDQPHIGCWDAQPVCELGFDGVDGVGHLHRY